MPRAWTRTLSAPLFDDISSRQRGELLGLYGLLIAANACAWIWAFVLFGRQPALLGTALLAYTFGLRHAVDADRIAAIDNVVRKLMQVGQRPLSVGFFFALGHSTVVVLATVAIAATAAALQGRLEAFREGGGVIGTGVSALFLLSIALVNLVVLVGVWRRFRHVRRGGGSRPSTWMCSLPEAESLRGCFERCSASYLGAGTCTRWVFCSASASIPRPRSDCSASLRRKWAKACRSGRTRLPGAVHQRHGVG
jgi:High-affinity nickel-transport protein